MKNPSRLWLALLTSGCVDQKLSVYNTPPEVSFREPLDGEVLVAGVPTTMSADVSDAQTAIGDLSYVWSSSIDGEIDGDSAITDSGISIETQHLSVGEHVLVLRVVDEAAEDGEDSVEVTVVNNTSPALAISSPADGDRVLLGVPIEVVASVIDDYSLPEQIALSWSGLDDLTTAPTAPTADGVASFTVFSTPAGQWTLYLTATDTMGAASNAYVQFTVFEDDDDGDGYADSTSGGTDCDDEDAAINPGTPEDCDAIDNDCSGVVDDEGTCDCTEESFGASTYLFCKEDKGWLMARDICAAQARHLLTVGDAEEDAWASDTTLAYDDTAVWWHGLNDLATEGSYVWDDGTSASYVNWASNQPDDQSGGDDCVQYHVTQGGGWNDLACSGDTTPYDTYFICE